MRIVSQEAAYWYIRCVDERAMPRLDRQLFFAWLKRSPENIAEILRVAEMDGKFAGKWLRERVAELEASNVVDIGLDTSASQYDYQPSDTVSDKVQQKPHGLSMWRMAAAVGAIALALVLAFVFLGTSDRVVETAAAQWQRKTLEDGSVVHLDARTRLKIEFTEGRRIVHLEHGWAVFDVVKDPKRPFIVSTDAVDVTAVGTKFGVALDDGVTTTVQEGTVKVTAHGNQDGSGVFLHKGEELRVRPADTLTLSHGDIVEVDAARKLMWVTGRVEMVNTTVGEIVHQFNRRHEIQVEIEDPRLAAQRIDLAIMQVDNVDDFIELMKSRGVVVMREGSTLTLRARSE
jgi:transmembrane sensor